MLLAARRKSLPCVFPLAARRMSLCCVLLLAAVTVGGPGRFAAAADRPPNFIVIFADDLGYGDLGCYGHPTIRTPNLDRMATEGMRLTQFYAAASVCTPSRAALLTGRYPIRSGMCSDHRRVLFPDSASGLPETEITLAEALRTKGYATGCVGKWHLGHLKPFLPTSNGFDSYYGIPYSNDMKPCPLMRDEETLEEPVDQTTLTRRYTEEVVKFIRSNRDKPFFMYYAQTFPHVPLFASAKFLNTSARGLYGDVVEELDWSVGEIFRALRELELDAHTLVMFTSDNGPWLIMGNNGGSAGLLREGKGSTWEGGVREPMIAWWPGRIQAGAIRHDIGSTMDIYATCLALAGVDPSGDRVVDGVDLSPVLFSRGPGERDSIVYYRGAQIKAVRQGPWKMHLETQSGYRGDPPERHDPPLLFHLEHDPSERHNVADKHPEVIAKLQAVIEAHRATVKPVEDRLRARIEKD